MSKLSDEASSRFKRLGFKTQLALLLVVCFVVVPFNKVPYRLAIVVAICLLLLRAGRFGQLNSDNSDTSVVSLAGREISLDTSRVMICAVATLLVVFWSYSLEWRLDLVGFVWLVWWPGGKLLRWLVKPSSS